jgi:uncharacterized membrane protein
MASCPKCGAQVVTGANFCPACGSPIGAAPSPTAIPPAQPSVQEQVSTAAPGGITSNVAAMLTYLPVCFIGLVCAILFAFVLEPYKKDRFIRFHAWQSLALHVAYIVFWIGWMIFSAVLTAITPKLAFITVPVSMLVGLGTLVLVVILMLKAYGNELYKLPVLGDWAEKRADR